MKFLKIQDYLKLVNPNPTESFRPEIITSEDKAFNMGGMLGILAPNTSVPYHYHKKRESVIIVISGNTVSKRYRNLLKIIFLSHVFY